MFLVLFSFSSFLNFLSLALQKKNARSISLSLSLPLSRVFFVTMTTFFPRFFLCLLSLSLSLASLSSSASFSRSFVAAAAAAAKPPSGTETINALGTDQRRGEETLNLFSISLSRGGGSGGGEKEGSAKEEKNDAVELFRYESTLETVLALATKRDDDDEKDENGKVAEREEEEETKRALSGLFRAEDFARKRDVILVSVCSSSDARTVGSLASSSSSSSSLWSASSAMFEFAAKATSSCEGSESVSMQCNRADFLEETGVGAKKEKADAYERALLSEAGVKSGDALTSSALRRLSEELACFSESASERFGERKRVSSAQDGGIEIAYAEICGMVALDALDATARKKIEAFVEKKIDEILDGVEALGVVVTQARDKNEVVESQRKRRALLQDGDSSEGGRSAKQYPNKATATIVGFILLLGAVSGFLAMLTMRFPTDSLLFPKTKDD